MLLNERQFILLDTETTGFNYKKHQILEIGILVIEEMKVKDIIDIKVKHKDYNITIDALEHNKIDLKEHDKIGITEEDACKEIHKKLKEHMNSDKGYIIIGQNVDFDISFMQEMFNRNNMYKEFREVISYRKLDLMQLGLIKTLEGKIDLESQSLDHMMEKLDVTMVENRHRAIIDCGLEFEVLKKLLKL
ncbi:MAG: 3'-5' exonuclease [Bacilli bacterium]|uniref:3'-5' exonuclease n=1 Tax=Clostridium sp. TaxID=1506 RepID=UPI002FC691DB